MLVAWSSLENKIRNERLENQTLACVRRAKHGAENQILLKKANVEDDR